MKAKTRRLEKAANTIVNEIIKNVGYYSEQKPWIKVDGDQGSVSIIWEEGPFEWATNDNYGLFEELKNEGMPGEYVHKPYWTDPKGIHTEAINSYSIGIYLA